MKIKQCPGCLVVQKINEFKLFKSIKNKDMIFRVCRGCRLIRARKTYWKNRKSILPKFRSYYIKNREKIRDQRRLHYLIPKNRKRILQRSIDWMKKNPEKYKALRQKHYYKIKARTIVHNAIQAGKMTRLPCIKCKQKNAHAHHEYYSKPLQVIWLCPPCHSAHHRSILPLHKL